MGLEHLWDVGLDWSPHASSHFINTVKNPTRRSTELPTEPSGWYEGAEMGSATAQAQKKVGITNHKLSNL